MAFLEAGPLQVSRTFGSRHQTREPAAALLPKQAGCIRAVITEFISALTLLQGKPKLVFLIPCSVSDNANQPTFLPLCSGSFYWVGLGPAGSRDRWPHSNGSWECWVYTCPGP